MLRQLPKPNTVKGALIHISLMAVLFFVLIFIFFYIYLPVYTHHGESITVPDIVGMPYTELDEFLEKRDLRYEILPDSGYSASQPPLSVLQQVPKPNSKVKQYRKIYLNLNAINPPAVKIPDIIGSSLRNALTVMESIGIEVEDIRYRPYPYQNAVLEIQKDGETLNPGDDIFKGSSIILIVGDNAGNPFPVPDVVGLMLEEAEFIIKGSSLKVGKITEDYTSDKPAGTVIKQFPDKDQSLRNGQEVDLWVAASEKETILD